MADLFKETKIDADVRGAFQRFDGDGDGHVDVEELKQALEFLGLPCSDAQTAAIMKKFDDDGNATLEIEEFQQLVTYFRTLEEMATAAEKIVTKVKARSKKNLTKK